MKRTTIFVPEALERDLQLYARRRGKPTAAIVREALAAYIAHTPTELPSFAAAFDSGFTDTAEHHEAMLFKRLSPHESGAAPAAEAPASPKSRRSVREGGRRRGAPKSRPSLPRRSRAAAFAKAGEGGKRR